MRDERRHLAACRERCADLAGEASRANQKPSRSCLIPPRPGGADRLSGGSRGRSHGACQCISPPWAGDRRAVRPQGGVARLGRRAPGSPRGLAGLAAARRPGLGLPPGGGELAAPRRQSAAVANGRGAGTADGGGRSSAGGRGDEPGAVGWRRPRECSTVPTSAFRIVERSLGSALRRSGWGPDHRVTVRAINHSDSERGRMRLGRGHGELRQAAVGRAGTVASHGRPAWSNRGSTSPPAETFGVGLCGPSHTERSQCSRSPCSAGPLSPH